MIGRTNVGGGENVKAEVEYQTPVISQILEGLVGKAQGANATADKILEGYSAYVGQERIEGTFKPITGIDFGEVTLSTEQTNIQVEHCLGTIPSYAVLVRKNGYSGSYGYINNNGEVTKGNGGSTIESSGALTYYKNRSITKTDRQIIFGPANQDSIYPYAVGEYYWIAIA